MDWFTVLLVIAGLIGTVMILYFIFAAYAFHKFNKKFSQESERIEKEFDEKWRSTKDG